VLCSPRRDSPRDRHYRDTDWTFSSSGISPTSTRNPSRSGGPAYPSRRTLASESRQRWPSALPCRVSPLGPDHLLFIRPPGSRNENDILFIDIDIDFQPDIKASLNSPASATVAAPNQHPPLPRLNWPTKDLPFRSKRRFPIVTGRGGRPSLSEISQIGGRGIVLIETSNPQSQSQSQSLVA
jgi:hypothetical protein